jgi:hypothetical protein
MKAEIAGPLIAAALAASAVVTFAVLLAQKLA